jgi:integrase
LWAQIENGHLGNSNLFTVRLDEYLVPPKFLALADKTRRQYEHVAIKLREFFKGATMGVITPAHIALWMDNHPSLIQANTGKAIVSNVFLVAVRHGLVDRNPCKEISYHVPSKRDRLITDDEYRAIRSRAQPFVQIAMDIAYLTASRVQDILDIMLRDITDKGLFIQQGKTGKRMLFSLNDDLREVLTRARTLPRSIRGMHLLCNRKGQPYLYGVFNWHWLKAVRAAGVQGVHFHDIRAKSATDAKGQGLDYQKLLGHTSRAMSDRYIRGREIEIIAPLTAQNLTKG